MAEKFIMLSLNDEKSKNLAEVLGNDSCKKIINLLAEKDASATEISNQLNIPLNTATYNIEKLVKSGLVEKENHWWSIKGKKIPIYTLSNKQIIISPKKSFSKLKTVIPVILASGIVAMGIKYFSEKTINNNLSSDLVQTSAPLAEMATKASGQLDIAPITIIFSPIWIWFLAGCLFSLIGYLIINKIFNKN